MIHYTSHSPERCFQMLLELCRFGGITIYLLWKACSMPTTLLCRTFPQPQSDPALAQLHAVSSGHVSHQRAMLPLGATAALRLPLSLLFSRLSKPMDLSCSSHILSSRHFTIFIIILLWTSYKSFISFLYFICHISVLFSPSHFRKNLFHNIIMTVA